MKRLLAALLFCAPPALAGTPKYSPVGGAVAVPLTQDNAYFRTPGTPAYDYWDLAAFYVPQYTGAACSDAAVTMALNALLNARRQRGDEEKNLDQRGVPDLVKGFPWKALVSEEGYEGRHGATLAQLGQAAAEAAAGCGADVAVTVTTVAAQTAQGLESFRRALSGNEKSPDDIMLLHFAQDAVTGAPGGPYAHVSPVGAYDEKTRRVLVMDVDREWYEPYWAADAAVYAAMAVRTKAFGSGGYVIIRKKK